VDRSELHSYILQYIGNDSIFYLFCFVWEQLNIYVEIDYVFLVQVDSVDKLGENEIGRLLKSKSSDPPSLAVLVTDDEFQVAYVVGDGRHINCKSSNVFSGLLVLIAVYYVMDLHYPPVYSQLLGILQQHVLQEPFTMNKGTKFINYSSKLNSLDD